MADITMCNGENCTIKKSCYRFTANASERQSWGTFKQNPETGECEHYWLDPRKAAKATKPRAKKR